MSLFPVYKNSQTTLSYGVPLRLQTASKPFFSCSLKKKKKSLKQHDLGFCKGTPTPILDVGFMNNAVTDAEIMPVVVSLGFFLIPSPLLFFLPGEKETLIMSNQRPNGDSWPNIRDLG
ncbi:hypothetical protein ILYODFUR_014356 [Ilyodon furcidens]|uniref:Uncharacterized protein n=1 Tax=Ilyodon furcidens TaxID=33524 RepID=A0ABV0URX4_9TELE